MDPITHIVTALAAGATAASQATADSAVKGTYAGLRAVVRERYPLASAGVEVLETEPGSKDLQTYVREKLSSAGAAEDGELFAQAQALLKAIQSRAPEIAGLIGVNLAGVIAAGNIYIQGIYITQNITYQAPSASAILTSPRPPDTFAGRRVEVDHLSGVLLKGVNAAISAAIVGMGGVGKSTVARKLGTDLAEHFPGGVLWLDVGYEAKPDDLASRLVLRLGLNLADEPQAHRRAERIRHELEQRGRLLAILDDLWDVDLGRWLMREVLPGDRAVLVTSRDAALSRALCHHVERLDTLREAEARELLANILGPLGKYEVVAREIVRLLEGLPLALELAAKLCDQGADDLPWLLKQLKTKPTLGVLRLPGQETPESSVEASLAVSYGCLEPDLQRRFRSLGVFAPALFDLAALATVWGDAHEDGQAGLDVDAAEEAARVLVSRGLLARAESRLEGRAEGLPQPVYAQHSLLRAYALALLEQQEEQKEEITEQHMTHYQSLAGDSWQQAELFWEQMEQAWHWAWELGPARALAYYRSVSAFLGLRGRHQARLEWIGTLLGLPENILDLEDQTYLRTSLGSAYSDLGEKRRALELYEQALPIYRQVEDKSGEAATLHNMGLVFSDLGEKQRALELYEQALSIERQTGDLAGEATTLNNMGKVYSDLGEKRRALEFYEQTLPIRSQVEDRGGEAYTLQNMATVYSELGEKRRALELFEQALSIICQVGDKAGEAGTLRNKGVVHSELGEKQRALELFEQALPIYREVGDKAGEAYALQNMASVYSDVGEKRRALELYAQVLSIRRHLGDNAGEAQILNSMGSLYDDMGEKRLALELYDQALPIYRQGRDKAGEAATLNNMGLVYSDLGEKRRALELYEEALTLKRQVGDKVSEAATLNNMGMVHFALGDHQRALALYEQALPIWRQAGHKSGEAKTLNNMGKVHSILGERQRALELFEQALPLRRQAGDRAGEATTLTSMGTVYRVLGDHQRALELLEQSMSIVRQVGDRAGEAVTLAGLGDIASEQGRLDEALDHYEQSLRLLMEIGDRWTESEYRGNLAAICQAAGDYAQAEAQLLRAVGLAEIVGHPDLESHRHKLARPQELRRQS